MFEKVRPPASGEIITAEYLGKLTEVVNRMADVGVSPGTQAISNSEFSRTMPRKEPGILYVVMIRDALLPTDPDFNVSIDNPDGEENAEVLEYDEGEGDWVDLGGRKVNVIGMPGLLPKETERVHVRYNTAIQAWIPIAISNNDTRESCDIYSFAAAN